jgi:anthranilate phosphoribosyltransferase
MHDLASLTVGLRSGHHLSDAEAQGAAHALASPSVPQPDKRAFLSALHHKGETIGEIIAFARTFRSLALNPGLDDWAARGIDIVGTGGTGSGGYNVSSVSACIVAAAGIPVLKHGNRAITSQSGSADFLALLGIPLENDPTRLRASLEALNFCFFFAPAFHPAFKEIGPVRKELAAAGQRTIFNILGPLINPAQPACQLLGVPRPELVQPLAAALSGLGMRRGIAVCCSLDTGYMDEFTSVGVNHCAGIGVLANTPLPQGDALAYGLPAGSRSELNGGTAADNMALLSAMLAGRGRPTLMHTIALNAGAALHACGHSASIHAGTQAAWQILTNGTLAAWLDRARAFHAAIPTQS